MSGDDVLDLGLNDENEFDVRPDPKLEDSKKSSKILTENQTLADSNLEKAVHKSTENNEGLTAAINFNYFLEKISGNITACQTEALKITIEESNAKKCCFINSPKGRMRHRLIASLFANAKICPKNGLQVRAFRF